MSGRMQEQLTNCEYLLAFSRSVNYHSSAMRINPEVPGDIDAVRRVNDLALGQNAEAAIVDPLLSRCEGRLSLVAEEGGGVVGRLLWKGVSDDAFLAPVLDSRLGGGLRGRAGYRLEFA